MLGVTAAIGGIAQLGQSIYGMVQGRRAIREAQKVNKPKFEVQQEFEQNRALALNRYNASNPYIAQATNNLNATTASATIAAQQTAGDSAAALQAITGAQVNAQNQQANLMAQATQMKDARFGDVVKANESLAGDKNRVTNQEYNDYMLAQQKEMAGKQGIMDAMGGISNMAGDIFSIGATEGTDVFQDIFKFRKKKASGIMGAGSGL
jgi:hypothetical protein